jgi:hypothetical protein
MGRFGMAGLLIFAAAFCAVPAQAELLAFDVALDGKYGAVPTGSAATGKARVEVDTERQKISMEMTIAGITRDGLWDRLVSAPIGPVHLHKYATAAGGDSVLVLPVPYGAAYQATADGMQITVKDYDYAVGAQLLKSTLPFDEFVTALRTGLIVLNVHTDAFNAGEISGRVGEGHGPIQPGAPHDH